MKWNPLMAAGATEVQEEINEEDEKTDSIPEAEIGFWQKVVRFFKNLFK